MRSWIACVAVIAACHKTEKDQKAPPAEPVKPARPVKPDAPWFDDVKDAPVAVTSVVVKQATLHGYDQYLPVKFTLTGKRAIADRQVLMVKASCRVGALVMASGVPAAIDLRQLEASTPKQVETIPFAMYGFTGKAQPCELSFFLDRQEPGTKPARFMTSCWSGGQLAAGRCADLVPRPGVAPFTLNAATAGLDGDQLVVDTTIIAGPGRVGDETVSLETRCEIDGKIVEGEVLGLSNLGYVAAGEAFRTTGTVPAASPTWCELAVVIERIVSGAPTTLGKRCLRDGKLTDGGC